jgi:predicted transcriptional regulator
LPSYHLPEIPKLHDRHRQRRPSRRRTRSARAAQTKLKERERIIERWHGLKASAHIRQQQLTELEDELKETIDKLRADCEEMECLDKMADDYVKSGQNDMRD